MKILKAIFFPIIFIILFSPKFVKADLPLLNWKVYTSLSNFSDFTLTNNGELYAASNGGLFILNLNNGQKTIMNNLNGLWDNDLSSIYYDSQSHMIYTGSTSGAINIIDEQHRTEIILDIYKSNFVDKKINEFISDGNKIFIATNFGLVAFDLTKKVFTETIIKFGDFSTNTAVNQCLILNNKIYLATNEGIAYTSLDSQLSVPKSWTTISISNAQGKIPLENIAEQDGNIYVSSDNMIYKIQADSLDTVVTATSKIRNFTKHNNRIYFTIDYTLVNLDLVEFPVKLSSLANKIYFFDNINLPNTPINLNYPVIASTNSGISYFKDNDYVNIIPNTPSSNLIYRLTTDKQNNLWVSTGKNPSHGFMKFDGTTWTNYFYEKDPQIITDGYINVTLADNGKAYCSSWGQGVLVIDSSNNNFINYNNKNSPLTGVATSDSFVVIGDIQEASDGTIWIVNYGETSQGPLLVALDKNNNFYSFVNCNQPDYRWYLRMVIDRSGTKWVASTQSGGLYYFNEMGTLDNTSDDICGAITTSNYPNLASNQQSALAIDHNDILWIGTPYGLSSIFNTSSVLYNQKPIVRNISLLANQVVNDIYIDAVDNKWIATNEGVWVLNPDATEVLTIINTSNSPLQTNIINTVAGNENTGKIYIGTNLGLYEIETLNVKPNINYSLKCYPQPFYVTKDMDLIIDGLATSSDVMISTISGKVVRKFSTDSRKIVWDGRDDLGNLVSSGIYLVYAQSRTGNVSGIQKIAVINN
jgi:ligand-binding sensor domain-containing protein